jgi:hypothetical protein
MSIILTRYDVGKLKPGDSVTVDGKRGVVTSTHEPEWIDHKTKAFRKVLQSADILFEGETTAYAIRGDLFEVTKQ